MVAQTPIHAAGFHCYHDERIDDVDDDGLSLGSDGGCDVDGLYGASIVFASWE